MKIQDKGIIISILKHGESSLVVKVLSRDNGIYSGYVKGGLSRKNVGLYQLGNVVDFVWSSRDSNNLGYLDAELIESYFLFVFEDRLALCLLESLMKIVTIFLPERQNERLIYDGVIRILELFKGNCEKLELLKEYVLFEKSILDVLGIGLDLKRCAGGGNSDNLLYISPKTGRAVSREKGEPYKDKLLILPKFFCGEGVKIEFEDVRNGLKATSYFLCKNLEGHGLKSKLKTIQNLHEKLLKFCD